MSRNAHKRSDKQQAERTAEHRRREKEQRKRDREPEPRADAPAKPPSKEWQPPAHWTEKTYGEPGTTLTIIGAQPPPA